MTGMNPIFSAHLGYLFTELAFDDRMIAARDAGFGAVEYPAPYDIPPDHMNRLLTDAGLPYVQFGMRSGDPTKGEKGIAIFPDRRDEFRANVAEALVYADRIGVSMVHAMAGILPSKQHLPHHLSCYLENLNYAADAAAKKGIHILVEAMSAQAVPGYFVSTATQAATVVRDAGHTNIRLLLDVFHTVSSGENPVTTIGVCGDLIGHVHIADAPGRHEPGSDDIDFELVYRALANAGYNGAIGCEYSPRHTTQQGIHWLSRHKDIAKFYFV